MGWRKLIFIIKSKSIPMHNSFITWYVKWFLRSVYGKRKQCSMLFDIIFVLNDYMIFSKERWWNEFKNNGFIAYTIFVVLRVKIIDIWLLHPTCTTRSHFWKFNAENYFLQWRRDIIRHQVERISLYSTSIMCWSSVWQLKSDTENEWAYR